MRSDHTIACFHPQSTPIPVKMTPETQEIRKRRAIIYIDGYNWYHAIFRHYPEWKWLNIQSFFSSLRPDEEIVSVKMFSAYIDHDPDARERQDRYFKAIQTLPKVKLILGVFQPREVTCRAGCKQKYFVPEEKKTDVNLAVEMIGDAVAGACDSIFVVSGDADVQPAVEWIANHRKHIKITVYVPAIPSEQSTRRTDYYRTKGLAVECKFLPLGGIKDHQMKHMVKISEDKFAVRPHIWQKHPINLATQ